VFQRCPTRDEISFPVGQSNYKKKSKFSKISKHFKICDRSLKRKKEPHRAPLVNIVKAQSMELVCIDYLTLEPSKGGQHNFLVITDHFTRYAQAIVTKNQTAKTTADALFHNFIVHYGIPQKIHSD
jgi:hypothetical protein